MNKNGWVTFDERAPTQDELNTDRVLGYFILHDAKGQLELDHYGKLMWDENAQSWAIEQYSPALPHGQWKSVPCKPTHWIILPELPMTTIESSGI